MSIKYIDHPWKEMSSLQQRRVDSKLNYNIFWITDINCNFGISIESSHLGQSQTQNIQLKGFDIYLESIAGTSKLYLVLTDKSEWQIFHSLCLDLINTAKSISDDYDKERKLIPLLSNRLLRWQQILQKDNIKKMSIEQQMGLFGELSCLYDFSKKRNLRDSVIAWVGCQSGKQDFLFDNLAVEVKSKKSSSGNKVYISSLDQLHCDKDPLYLLVYSLTSTENGESIQDMVEKIKLSIEEVNVQSSTNFEKKLMDYGYIHEIEGENLLKFIIDKKQVYIVDNTFPKINPHSLDSQIRDVRYSIDLSQCEKYKRSFEKLFN
ncbi:PD-(D/E)XK motif protein [Psychrobacter sp. GP33]|uniref:PD-(D/E)XK motif protein n=1 Tax=Psychrobacter sp. GP33 TaxID=2758709 RepID=UPI0015FD88B3|nr:PD-(D/E)XK motif protein [Psychrobacter sp. GP33]